MIVEVETRAGFSWCTARTQTEADTHLVKSRDDAAAECLRLATEIEQLDPQRAQRLRTVANDPNSTRDQRWGAYKNDERAPRETQATETRVR